MAKVKSLNDLFLENLRRTYDTEKRLITALPKLRDAATSEELRHALTSHFEETEGHVDRIERVFEWFGETPRTEPCEAIKGILDDGRYAASLDLEPSVKDAAIIAAAQEAEHLEMALYGTLRTWAAVLGSNESMQALELTLEEEKAADSLLTGIAATLNLRAAHAK